MRWSYVRMYIINLLTSVLINFRSLSEKKQGCSGYAGDLGNEGCICLLIGTAFVM